jgi:bifunctional enzyme CysN/CysC
MNDGFGLPPSPAGAGERALPIVVVGHVDHGKSTLVGRLLHDTGSLPPARIEQLRAVSAKRGLDLEFSFLLDSLQVERDQGITVDAAQIWFRTARRRYVIIDAPGHTEFLRNMVTGAAAAEAAVLVVDAQQGVAEQTRRHGYLLGILGLKQVAVAVNKIDLIDHDPARFAAIKAEVEDYLAGIGLRASAVIPLSARHGDNVARPAADSGAMPWYTGPTLVEALDGFAPRPEPVAGPLRLPVQDVYRLGDRRVVVGRIESGRLSVGDELRFAPGGQTARVAAIEAWNNRAPRRDAAAGENVALSFDHEVFVERGHVAGHRADGPAEGHVATVRLFWLDREPLRAGDRLSLRYGTAERRAVVEAIEAVIDVEAPTAAAPASDSLAQNGVARVRLRSRRPFALDTYAENPRTGRGVLARDHRVAGGFVVEALPERATAAAALNLTTVDAPVTAAERAAANGHRGGVLWLTGLSGAGKSSLAMPLLRGLADRGRQAYVLDGDNIRQGLNRDLGFRPEDRTENIRRVAEVARLMADAGLVVVVALISPLAADRAMARGIVGEGFHEVYVKADLAACEARDPKGLYRKARQDKIREFTGVSAPYEPPTAPDLELDTTRLTVEEGVRRLLDYAEAAFVPGPAKPR